MINVPAPNPFSIPRQRGLEPIGPAASNSLLRSEQATQFRRSKS
jgi:hypothetical protein